MWSRCLLELINWLLIETHLRANSRPSVIEKIPLTGYELFPRYRDAGGPLREERLEGREKGGSCPHK